MEKYSRSRGAGHRPLLSAMVTFLIRWGMGRPYRVNATATASKYFVSRSTLSKMITGKKFYGGQQAKKMKDAGESTVTRKGKGEGKKSKPKKGKGSEQVKTEATKEKGERRRRRGTRRAG